MMNRRQFVFTATAAAAFARTPDVFAASAKKYDLIVKGGRVIDPSRKLDAISDLAIANGHSAAIDKLDLLQPLLAICRRPPRVHR